MPVGEARRLLGPGKIIGFSAHDVAEARRAEEEGADYLGVGAVYPTPTKRDADVVGVGRIREICRSTRFLVLAIGGIARENVREVLGAGATGVAVISAVIGASDPAAAARDLLKEIGDFEMGQDLPRRTRRSRN
jgi:thiamine-phosphate diphosphorylase